MTTSAWQRTAMGYLSRDRRWFLERGAPMTPSGTAWLIWRQVGPLQAVNWSASNNSPGLPYLEANGAYLRTVAELTMDEDFPRPNGGRDLYEHVADAGSLAEAKGTVEAMDRAVVQ